MNTAEQVLVIVLSGLLALFLTLSIAAVIIFIKILRQIKLIVRKAESIADHAESVSSFFQHTAGPAAVGKLVSNIFHTIREQGRTKHK